MSFVHLHVHTQYSLLDGANKIGPLIEHAKTIRHAGDRDDRPWQYVRRGRVLLQGRQHGIKPIIGCEAYLAPGKRTDRTQISQG